VPRLRHAAGPSRRALRPPVLRDDAGRESDYATGAERALEHAATGAWTTVSIKDDWAAVVAG
jgi:hypothetical protein